MSGKILGESFRITANEYDRYRPPYPLSLIREISSRIKPEATVADIAAGTGMLSIPLMSAGNTVYHVDISATMNDGAHKKRKEFRHPYYDGKITVIEGSGNKTSIPDKGVDAIIVGNASHWLIESDYLGVFKEFQRISKPGAKIIVVFNAPDLSDKPTDFLIREIQTIFPANRVKSSFKNLSDMDGNATAFIDPKSLDQYRESYVWNITREEFIGFVGTSPGAIKDGMNDERRAKLNLLFDRYAKDTADGKRLPLKSIAKLYCGTQLPLKEASIINQMKIL